MQPGQTLLHYGIVERIGEGRMGKGRKVALKVLPGKRTPPDTPAKGSDSQLLLGAVPAYTPPWSRRSSP